MVAYVNEMLLHGVFAFCLNMVFNRAMSKHYELHPDAKVIADLGGPTKVAELLEYDKAHGGVQRVQNWMKRGIPSHVKLNRPDLFLTDLIDRMKAADDVQAPVGAPDRKAKRKGGTTAKKVKETRAV